MPNNKVSNSFTKFSIKACSELGYQHKGKGKFKKDKSTAKVSQKVFNSIEEKKNLSDLKALSFEWLDRRKDCDPSTLDDTSRKVLETTENIICEELDQATDSLREIISSDEGSELEDLEHELEELIDIKEQLEKAAYVKRSISSPALSSTKKTIRGRQLSDPRLSKSKEVSKKLRKSPLRSKRREKISLNKSSPAFSRLKNARDCPINARPEHLEALYMKYFKKSKVPYLGTEKLADTLQFYERSLNESVMRLQMRQAESEDVSDSEIESIQKETRFFAALMRKIAKDLVTSEELLPEARYIPALGVQAVQLEKVAASLSSEESVIEGSMSADILVEKLKNSEGNNVTQTQAKTVASELGKYLLETPPSSPEDQVNVAKALVDTMANDPLMYLWTSNRTFEQTLERAVHMFPKLPSAENPESSRVDVNTRLLRIEHTVMNAKRVWTTQNLASIKNLQADYANIGNNINQMLKLYDDGKVEISNYQLMRMAKALSVMHFYLRQIQGIQEVINTSRKKSGLKLQHRAGSLVPTQVLGDKLRGRSQKNVQKIARKRNKEKGVNALLAHISECIKVT